MSDAFHSEMVIPVIAGVVVLFIGFVSKRIWTKWFKPFSEEKPSVLRDEIVDSVVGNVSGNISNSPVAIGGTVHQLVTYQTSPPAQPTEKRISRPTPDEIKEYFARLTPYQLTQPQTQYHGLTVSWPLRFCSLSPADVFPEDKNQMRVMATQLVNPKSEIGNWMHIFFEISIQDFPEFKIARHGDKMWVKGRILRAHSTSIDLENPVEVEWIES